MRRRRSDHGFTLLEVLVALIIGMIGLIGTVAIQQTMMRVAFNANDSGVAMRLATQQMELFAASTTNPGPPITDELTPFVNAIATPGNCSAAAPRCRYCPNPPPSGTAGNWCTEFLDSSGRLNTGNAMTPVFRWRREWRIVNPGVNSPFNISARVYYQLDSGVSKFIQVDAQRLKIW